MEKEYDKSIRPVLDTFDKIREILRFEKIELPKIVVVGDQSAGKSSVLESITGICLPRGENTVTKCPIVIQIRGVESYDEEMASVRIEGESNDRLVEIPLKNLHEKIHEKQIENLNKDGSEITDTPMYVYVKKFKAPDLTLYDLPGITYKTENVTANIRNIISKYTSEKQTLILLVLAANTDLTTTEGLSLIRKNQDYKDRTIPIITKIDLVVNQEKRLFSKIINNELDLRFNPIVVRNRTQDEIDNNESSESVKKKERLLIQSNEQLNLLPNDCKGTDQLIFKLIYLQRENIMNSKIEIKEKILEKLKILRHDFEKLPLPAETPTEKLDRFKDCLFNLINNLQSVIKGHYVEIDNISENFPNLTFNIRQRFENFNALLDSKKEYFFSEDFRKKVSIVINDTRGFKLANFSDQDSFHHLMKKEISSIANVTDQLILDCSDYVKEVINKISESCFINYSKLQKAIKLEITELIDIQVSKTKFLIKELHQAEKELEWTINPYYMDTVKKVIGNVEVYKKNPEQMQEHVEVNDCMFKKEDFKNLRPNDPDSEMIHLTQISCFTYWKTFLKRFVDYCQLIILKNLVFFFRDNLGLLLEKKFSPNIGQDGISYEYITEDLAMIQKRNEIRKSKNNLEEAFEQLNKII